MRYFEKYGAKATKILTVLAVCVGLLATAFAAPVSVVRNAAAARPRYDSVFSLGGGWQTDGDALKSDAAGRSEAWLRNGSYTDATVELNVCLGARDGAAGSLAIMARAENAEGYAAELPLGAAPTLKAASAVLDTASSLTVAADRTYAVRFTQSGETLTVTVDGESVLTATDSAFARGNIGLIATDAAVTVTAFRVEAADPYHDYGFERAEADDLSGLEIGGGWQNVGDRLTLTDAQGDNIVYIKGSEGFVDGTLAAKTTFVAPNTEGYAAFSFITRQENVGDHQKSNEINVEFNGGAFTGINLRSFNYAVNRFAVAASVTAEEFAQKYGEAFAFGKPYAVEVVSEGNTVTLSFDGHEIFSGSGLLYVSGKVGFDSFLVNAELDDVTLTPKQENAAARYESDFIFKPDFLSADADVVSAEGMLVYPEAPSTGDKILWVTDSVEWQDAVIEFDVTFKTLNAGSEFTVFTRHNGPNWQYSNHVKFASGYVDVCRRLSDTEDGYRSYGRNEIVNAADTQYHIRVENIGAALRVYRDGVLLVESNDSYYGHGEIGFNMWLGQVELDNLSISTPKTLYTADEPAEYRGMRAAEDAYGWRYDSAARRLDVTSHENVDHFVWLNGANNMKSVQTEFDLTVDGVKGDYSSFQVELRSNGLGQQSNHIKFEPVNGNIVFGRLYNGAYTTYGILKYAFPEQGSTHFKLVMIGRYAHIYADGAYLGRSEAFPADDAGIHLGFSVWNTDVTLDGVEISQPSERYEFTVGVRDERADQTLRLGGGWTYGGGKLYIANTAGNNAVFVKGTEDWTGGAVSFKLKLTDPNGAEPSIFNVAFGVPNTTTAEDFQDGNVMSLEQAGDSLNVKIYNGKGATPTVYASVPDAVQYGREYEVSILNVGGVMTLTLDGTVIATSDRMAEKTGSIALVGFFIGAEVRDFAVTHGVIDASFTARALSVELPEDAEYIEGQALDLADCVTAVFADGYERALDASALVVTPARLAVGENRVTVALKANPTVSETLTVTARAKQATAFEIVTPPAKRDYVTGERIDLTGIVYRVTYDNGVTEQAATDTRLLEAEADLTAAAQGVTVTVKLGTLSDTYTVDVVKKDITAIAVKTPPTQTEYIVGNAISLEGLVIEATYNDGSKGELALDRIACDVVKFEKAGEVVTVTVSLKADPTLTATFSVRVNAAKIVSIAIKAEPDKTVYTAGDGFDATGLVVEATYDNGEKRALAADEYEVSADLSEANLDAVVTVTLKADSSLTVAFHIVVNKKKGCNSALGAGAFGVAAALLLAAGAMIAAKRKKS